MSAVRILVTYKEIISLQAHLPRLLRQAAGDAAAVIIVKRLTDLQALGANAVEQIFCELRGIQAQLQVSAPDTPVKVLAMNNRAQVLTYVAGEKFDQVLWLDTRTRPPVFPPRVSAREDDYERVRAQ